MVSRYLCACLNNINATISSWSDGQLANSRKCFWDSSLNLPRQFSGTPPSRPTRSYGRLFWPEQIPSQSFSYLKNFFNTATRLIRPEFCDPLLTGLTGFHCSRKWLFSAFNKLLAKNSKVKILWRKLFWHFYTSHFEQISDKKFGHFAETYIPKDDLHLLNTTYENDSITAPLRFQRCTYEKHHKFYQVWGIFSDKITNAHTSMFC